ncbi:ribonuclease H-like domain-containing protein [Tanacetum coccineum]
MIKLLEKDSVFDFNEECIKAFEMLKEKLTNAPIMVSPDWSQPFELMCDASDFTVGAVLGQCEGKHFRLGYNAVPPPYTGNFMPPKPDLSFSGLKEFVNEPIVKKPVVETSEAKASADEPKVVRKDNSAPIIEDWVSDSEEEDVPRAKIKKKSVKHSFAKIKFGKSKEQVKTPRKTTVKQAIINVVRPKAVLNAVKGNQVNAVKALACWVWKPKTKGNPQQDLEEKGVIDSGCSRHMTGNMSYLTNFEEID